MAEAARTIMPYLYTALCPTLIAIVVALCIYERLRLPLPNAARLGLRVILVLVAAGMFALSLTTGNNPIISITTYRPLIVSIRGAMFFVAGGTLHVLLWGLHAHWRAPSNDPPSTDPATSPETG